METTKENYRKGRMKLVLSRDNILILEGYVGTFTCSVRIRPGTGQIFQIFNPKVNVSLEGKVMETIQS